MSDTFQMTVADVNRNFNAVVSQLAIALKEDGIISDTAQITEKYLVTICKPSVLNTAMRKVLGLFGKRYDEMETPIFLISRVGRTPIGHSLND